MQIRPYTSDQEFQAINVFDMELKAGINAIRNGEFESEELDAIRDAITLTEQKGSGY